MIIKHQKSGPLLLVSIKNRNELLMKITARNEIIFSEAMVGLFKLA
jgi:hypothetical protein